MFTIYTMLEEHEALLSLTTEKIAQMNQEVLEEVGLEDQLYKFDGYRYVDEVSDLKHGAYIKWIQLRDENGHIHYGMICDIKPAPTGIVITCKNFMHRYYAFRMDECLIFQKLTKQEQIVLAALDCIADADADTDTDT